MTGGWYPPASGGASLSDANPAALGSVAAGVASDASRADHVHAMPSASDVGAQAASATTAETPVTTTFTGGSAQVIDTLVADGVYSYRVEYYLLRTAGGSGQRVGTLRGRVSVASGVLTVTTPTPRDSGSNGGGASYAPAITWAADGLDLTMTIGTAGSDGDLEYTLWRTAY